MFLQMLQIKKNGRKIKTKSKVSGWAGRRWSWMQKFASCDTYLIWCFRASCRVQRSFCLRAEGAAASYEGLSVTFSLLHTWMSKKKNGRETERERDSGGMKGYNIYDEKSLLFSESQWIRISFLAKYGNAYRELASGSFLTFKLAQYKQFKDIRNCIDHLYECVTSGGPWEQWHHQPSTSFQSITGLSVQHIWLFDIFGSLRRRWMTSSDCSSLFPAVDSPFYVLVWPHQLKNSNTVMYRESTVERLL